MSVKVAVIRGGNSAESAVSLVTAKEVSAALSAGGYEVSEFDLDQSLPEKLLRAQPAAVFPAVHGAPGEDGSLQGLLEILGIPYVGSAVLASAVAMNKFTAKLLFQLANLPVTNSYLVSEGDDLEQAVAAIKSKLDAPPFMVKPNTEGSALGASRVFDSSELRPALERAISFGGEALVEEFIEGREMTVGILEEDGGCRALPLIEIHSKKDWYDYEARYTPGMSVHDCPANVPPEVGAELERIALQSHRVLGCRDMSRADFILTPGNSAYLLEVNTLPGMTPTSLFPDAAKAAGISFIQLMDHLIKRALQRRAQ